MGCHAKFMYGEPYSVKDFDSISLDKTALWDILLIRFLCLETIRKVSQAHLLATGQNAVHALLPRGKHTPKGPISF